MSHGHGRAHVRPPIACDAVRLCVVIGFECATVVHGALAVRAAAPGARAGRAGPPCPSTQDPLVCSWIVTSPAHTDQDIFPAGFDDTASLRGRGRGGGSKPGAPRYRSWL
eukprot:343099-Chlamydomonas_euryale.AAC.1